VRSGLRRAHELAEQREVAESRGDPEVRRFAAQQVRHLASPELRTGRAGGIQIEAAREGLEVVLKKQ